MNNETIPFEESLFVNQSGKYILSILNEFLVLVLEHLFTIWI